MGSLSAGRLTLAMTVEQRDEGMTDHQPVKFCYLDRKEVQYVLDEAYRCPRAGNDGSSPDL